jgi:uracil-DNA glycosylase family 4
MALDPALSVEARALLASAREVLAELIDEGVDGFERGAGAPEAGAQPSSLEQIASSPPERIETSPPAQTETRAGNPLTDRLVTSPDAGTLDAVRAELGDCRRCDLCEGRSTIVFGDGNPAADLMFIGEGPGEQEDRRGLPFVGRAGELLTGMIEKGLGISRSSVYICNIVKCRPPQNRTPLPREVAACRPFLDGQIDAVQPRVIVTLGKPAASLLLDRDVAITRLRGTWQEYRGIPLMPTLHPAYVLRQYTPENRRNVWEDLKAALARSQEGSRTSS